MNKIKGKINKYPLFFQLMIVMMVSFCLNVIMTFITLPKGSKSFLWSSMTNRPFVAAVLLIALLFLVLYILPKRVYILSVGLLSLLLVILSVASSIKSEKRSEPLIPQDVFLIKEAMSIGVKYLNAGNVILLIGLIILFIVWCVWILKKTTSYHPNWIKRIIIALISLAIILGISQIDSKKVWKKAGLTKGIQYPIDNIEKNGFVMANYFQILNIFAEKPEGYSESKAKKIISRYQKTNYPISKEKPNIIVIQWEAFFDPTTLPNVEYTYDPIPTFHNLVKNYTSGTLGVNVFAGGTANSEFEVLTSLNTRLFSYYTIPFLSHVHGPTESVAWDMMDKGYQTAGIHDHLKSFYNREQVYPYLGLTHTVFREDMDNPVIVDNLAVDTELTKYIIKRTNETKKKDFIMAVGVESHGPYPDYNVAAHPNQIKKSTLTISAENTLENYIYKLHEVDNAIKELIDYYKKQKEPTVIVMYGDHLPLLGDNKAAYLQSGFISKEDTKENYEKTYSTPLVIWDNYRHVERKDVHIGTSFLMPYLLKELGMKANPLQTFLQKKMDEGTTNLPVEEFQKDYGWTKDEVRDYRYLQYYYLNIFKK